MVKLIAVFVFGMICGAVLISVIACLIADDSVVEDDEL